jgi:hypothetical protein
VDRTRLHLLSAAATAAILIAGYGPALAQLRGTGGPADPATTGSTASTGNTGLSVQNAEPAIGTVPPVGIRRPARPPKPTTRRSRNPVQALPATPFRATLTPPALAADVQPQLNGVPAPELATRVTPPPLSRKKPVDEDPYGSLGVRVGGVTLFPAIEQSLGYDSNPNRTSQRKGSFVSHTEGELRLQSDWNRHELSGFLRGAYNEYPAVPEASRPEGAGRLGLRVDVLRDTQVNVEGRYLIDTQRPDSPDLLSPVRTRPLVFSEGGTLGVTQRFNRLVASLQGTIDRTDYENASTPGGILIDQSDRNITQYGVRGRLGYELSPGFIPFLEALADTRVYDRRLDNAGYARSSDGFGGRAGSTFEITRLITGEIAAGAINRRYDDPRLGDLTSPLVDASLVWAMTPLTTIKATAQATVDETSVANATGVRTVRGLLELSHALRRNLIVTGGLTVSDYDYQGAPIHERGYGALVRANWKLTRSVAVRASYNWERLNSSIAGSSYTANVFLLGMRYQP